MPEFQILDVDYIIVNERPVIRIFGKDSEGSTVCGFYEDFLPYFYVLGDDAKKLLEHEAQVLKIEQVERKVIGAKNGKPVYKVTLKNPAKTSEIREELRAKGAEPFEADILFKYRFMCDFGLSGLGWVKTSDGNGIATDTVNVDKKFKVSEIKPLKKEEDSQLKLMAVDIECVPLKEGLAPDAKKDPVVLISMGFNGSYKGKKEIVLGTKADKDVTGFENEGEMLGEFIKIVNEYDPDMITGFNINNFDIPYLLERMKQNGIKPIFGRCKQKFVTATKMVSRYKVNIVGRIMVDSYEIVKRDFSLKRYDLGSVAENLLQEKKDNVKHSQIEKLWKGNQEDLRKLIAYARKDAYLAMELVVRLNLLDKYIALAKISGTLLQDTLIGGETSRVENFLLREFNKEGYVFPCKPQAWEIGRREGLVKVELKGGFVLEPERGLHSDVVVMDFRSMYPSIIRSFNICPTTLVRNGDGNTIKTPSGAEFLPKEVKQGIIPRILEELMKRRQAVKKKLKQTEDVYKRKSLDAEQWALKIMANAFYGHLGYPRAKIYDLEIANAITSCGRDIIQKTKGMIEKEFGYRVVYGDTDSVLVKLPMEDLNEIKQKAGEIANYITKQLPVGLELDFEKIFKRFLPLTKKRYVAWKFEETAAGWAEGIEMKGVETIRRDWCQLVSEAMGNVIEILLKKSDVKESVKYFKGVIEDLLKGNVPLQKLVITKTMTKPPRNYAGMQPHIELVKKIQLRNPAEAPGIGDRIEYVIVKGTGLLSKRAEDPVYVMDNGLQIDSQYYIENQLMPPLERIFAVLGISKSELLGNGKQMGLMDILNNHHELVMARDLNLEEVTGFVCEKCSRIYSRPPLTGSCECGGPLLFSSPQGVSKSVLAETPM